MSAAETWRVALAAHALATPAYEAALGPFASAVTIFEREDAPPTSRRGLPEPATWAGDLWLAEACVVEAVVEGRPDREAIAAAVAVVAASLNETAPEIVFEKLEDVDWQALVLADMPAIRAGRFRVRGGHVTEPAPPGVIDLVVEAGAAFGSGEHETTRACLLALTAALKRGRPRNVLDIGCGTGVLGIAAAKAARPRLLMTDIDPRAVETARATARRNGVLSPVVLADGWADPSLRRAAPFDLVLANILARPLRAMAGDLAAGLAPGGRAILSGFLYWQEPFVLAAHRPRGLILERRTRVGDWLALTLRRAPRRPGPASPTRDA